MTGELIYATANELLEMYKNKQVSPVEVTQAVLDRIHSANERLNAFVQIDDEGALKAARQSEKRWHDGAPEGKLDGVPTTIKDIVLMKGFPTYRGSNTIDADGPWNDDSPAVARLKEHNAIIVGKTTTPEFGWKGVTDSPKTGITRNPWDISKTPGGSSGGASAACAAGMGALHIGTDGGGSIRIPAGFTGIFGHKPSFGLVPAWPLSAFGTLSHVGPMTRSVKDAALMLEVISEEDSRDWFAQPPGGRDFTSGLANGFEGLRIAYSPDLGYADVDEEVATAVDQAVETMIANGVNITRADPGFDNPLWIFNRHWWAGAYSGLGGLSEEQKQLLDPGLREVLKKGEAISLEEYLEAVKARGELGIFMNRFHQQYDLLITPSLAAPAFEAGALVPGGAAPEETDWTGWTPFSYPFNLTQQPACSIPCGFTRAGLPVGLQFVGAKYQDATVLQAAAAFERMCPVTKAWPDF